MWATALRSKVSCGAPARDWTRTSSYTAAWFSLTKAALKLPQFGVDNNGKVLRVVGKLTLSHNKKVSPTVQGYEWDFEAFIIKPEEVKILDRAKWPWMEDLGTPAQPRPEASELPPGRATERRQFREDKVQH